MNSPVFRRVYWLSGIVQGVGLRPALAQAAQGRSLGGSVQNCGGKVRLELTGKRYDLDKFISEIHFLLPPNACLDSLVLQVEAEHVVEQALSARPFEVILSEIDSSNSERSIPPDFAICKVCSQELADFTLRRAEYPFITCNDCGPRYSIIDELPFDRERTSMSAFAICEQCGREYADPKNRRFHSETISCPICGPRLEFTDSAGNVVSGDPIRTARQKLKAGFIVALKGIGGYQLVLDARRADVIARLRVLKNRPAKPLAVMAPSLEIISEYCIVSAIEKEVLASPARPITTLELKSTAKESLPSNLAPDAYTLGVMLPTSALHELLFMGEKADEKLDWLVVTSGNNRGEPMLLDNEQAFQNLSSIADYFLHHNRRILRRVDDSVVRQTRQGMQVLRRARGYAPRPVNLIVPVQKKVLAVGSELKNASALAVGNKIYVSPHIGDLSDLDALDAADEMVRELPVLLNIVPEVIATDLHPDMHSTRLAERLAERYGVGLVRVQHHHAHAVSCMVEHGLNSALALVFDGLGYGDDGTVWGAECLWCDGPSFKRLGSFKPAPLPGGDKAVQEPFRQLLARLSGCTSDVAIQCAKSLGVDSKLVSAIHAQISSGINTPWSRAAGRVFDTFSVLCGAAPRSVSYDGQAALCLETLASSFCGERNKAQPLNTRSIQEGELFLIDWSATLEEAWFMLQEGVSRERIAFEFHLAMAYAGLDLLRYAAEITGLNAVVLSGGVFMNRLFTDLFCDLLENEQFAVYMHRDLPTNDGGLAVGQAAVAGALGEA